MEGKLGTWVPITVGSIKLIHHFLCRNIVRGLLQQETKWDKNWHAQTAPNINYLLYQEAEKSQLEPERINNIPLKLDDWDHYLAKGFIATITFHLQLAISPGQIKNNNEIKCIDKRFEIVDFQNWEIRMLFFAGLSLGHRR